jgi:hypothetical protein
MIDYKLWLHIERHNDANDEYLDMDLPIELDYFDGHSGRRDAEKAAARIQKLYEFDKSPNGPTGNENRSFTPKQEEMVIEMLWESLRRDPEHRDRRQTAWGTKTKEGLIASIRRIAYEGK